jgi:hypothetical protein
MDFFHHKFTFGAFVVTAFYICKLYTMIGGGTFAYIEMCFTITGYLNIKIGLLNPFRTYQSIYTWHNFTISFVFVQFVKQLIILKDI